MITLEKALAVLIKLNMYLHLHQAMDGCNDCWKSELPHFGERMKTLRQMYVFWWKYRFVFVDTQEFKHVCMDAYGS